MNPRTYQKKSQQSCGRWTPQPHPISWCPSVPLYWCPAVKVSQSPWGERKNMQGGTEIAQGRGETHNFEGCSYRGGAHCPP